METIWSKQTTSESVSKYCRPELDDVTFLTVEVSSIDSAEDIAGGGSCT